MKNILLILALLSLGVSKAQVVGGYLPLNSTKSATMGGLRVNGTSTFTGNALFSSSVGIGALPNNALSVFQSVKGTGSVNIGESVAGFGALWFDTPVSASNYALRGNGANTSINSVQRQQHNINNTTKGVWTSTGLRVGSSSDPTAVLDVTGDAKVSSTFSLGSAQLTGGNTGTVAVLSDALFCVSISNNYNTVTALNFADATTYYWGNGYSPTTNSLNGQFKLPYNCTLVGWDFFATAAAVASSSETGTLSIAGTTNYTMSTAITFSTAYNNYYTNGLSQSFNANDLLNIKFLTPTWATNPTQLFIGINLWFVRRS